MTLAKNADLQTGEILPVLGDPREIQEVLDDNLAGDEISPFDLDRVKIPTGGATAWTVPTMEGDEMVKEIQGVIIGHRITRTYWAKSFESSGGGSSPDCSCPDIKTGRGTGDPGGDCDRCPLNQWGSDPDGGPGKACRQSHLLFVMRPDELLPMVIVASPGSLAALRQYFSRLSSRRMNHRHVVTGLGLEKASNKNGLVYSRILPRLVAVLDEESKERANGVYEALAPLLSAVEVMREDIDGPAEPNYGHHHVVTGEEIDNIFPADEPGSTQGAEGLDESTTATGDQAQENGSQGLQGDYSEVIEKAREYNLDESELLEQVIGEGMSWEAFEHMGGSPDIAMKRLANWAKGRRPARNARASANDASEEQPSDPPGEGLTAQRAQAPLR